MNNIVFRTIMLKGEQGGTIESIEKIAETGSKDILRINLSDGGYVDFEVNNTVDEEKMLVIIQEQAPSIIAAAVEQANAYTDSHVPSIASIVNTIYPVGSIYISTLATNPASYLGVGTWTAWGRGRVIAGVDPNDSDFNTVEKTGGAKSNSYTPSGSVSGHALSVSEMPAHNHGGRIQLEDNAKDHLQIFTGVSTSAGDYTLVGVDYTGELGNTFNPVSNGGGQAHAHGFNGSAANIPTLQPYITAYIWKRTA